MARGRQEHLALMRQLAGALPARFADLAALGGGDAETDPLVNLAHLQLHRRTRALNRLAQARQRPCAERSEAPCVSRAEAAQVTRSRSFLVRPDQRYILRAAAGCAGT